MASVTITLTSPVSAGDLLVGWFGQYNATGQVTVSDNVNGAWTRSRASTTFGSGSGHGDLALYYLQNSAAAPSGLTITITAPSATYLQGAAADYSGVATTGALDQTAAAKATSTTVDSGPTASVAAGELVVRRHHHRRPAGHGHAGVLAGTDVRDAQPDRLRIG